MRIVMMGTGTFAEPTFEALLQAFPGQVVGLITQPERDTGKKRGSTRQTGKGMAAIAEAAGVPVARPESINTPEGLESLRHFQADLAVVAAYGQILKPDVISTPKLGMINVHASLLPKYRGAAPVAHAIWNGETQTGVTIIRVTPGLDSGEMLARGAVDIFPQETAGELEARLAPVGADLAVQVVRQMSTGPVAGEAQDAAVAKQFRAPKLTKEMGLIDWNQPAARVIVQVRALQPWPTPYTFLHRQGKPSLRLVINHVSEVLIGVATVPPVTADSQPLAPGSVVSPLHLPAGMYGSLSVLPGLFVATGSTMVQVQALTPAGKKRMTAEEFLRGYPVQPGDRMGPEENA